MQQRPTFQQIAEEYQYLLPLPLPPAPGIKRPETGREQTPRPAQAGGQTKPSSPAR